MEHKDKQITMINSAGKKLEFLNNDCYYSNYLKVNFVTSQKLMVKHTSGAIR